MVLAMTTARLTALATAALLSGVAAGCGPSGPSGTPTLDVSAATSLKTALSSNPPGFPSAQVRAQFAGSDQLAAQIRAGARPDVFASANAKLPAALFKEGRVQRPVAFTRNELVLAVPAGSHRVERVEDLASRGVSLAIGAPAVPVGAYTRKVLSHLSPAVRSAILRNVRSAEPDVAGIVGKLTQGAVDAGFAYRTDVRATNGRLRAITLPADLAPAVIYDIAVVKGAQHPSQARAYIAMLLGPQGQAALRRAGFLPLP